MSDTNIGSPDLVLIFSTQDQARLGVILSLIEAGPTGVAKIIAQLDSAGGSIGKAVVTHYNACKAEIATVP